MRSVLLTLCVLAPLSCPGLQPPHTPEEACKMEQLRALWAAEHDGRNDEVWRLRNLIITGQGCGED